MTRIIEPQDWAQEWAEVWVQHPRAPDAPVLLDILSPEHYAAIHLPHAVNACVYEVAFIGNVVNLAPDKKTEIVLYDMNSAAHAAASAATKLEKAGYTNLTEIKGGLEAWLAQGLAVEPIGAALPAEPVIADKNYVLDCDKSILRWTGRNLNGAHNGTIPFSSGALLIENGTLSRGNLVADMKGIRDVDMAGTGLADVLVAHLLSDDFFDVEVFPTAEATFVLARPIAQAPAGSPNVVLNMNLTIKDITHPVQIPAIVAPDDKGIKMHAAFDIDRTRWNVIYGSGKYFKALGSHLVDDTISIEFFLKAG
ncbi:MAG TPA: sulfurtransferase [Rhodospirillaceae bacterium]|nr:sulfurtransferase [Rhodospirillaceae bacterium]